MAEETKQDERAAFDAAYERIKAGLEEKIRVNRESARPEIETLGSVIRRQEEIEARQQKLEEDQRRAERKLDLLLARAGIS